MKTAITFIIVTIVLLSATIGIKAAANNQNRGEETGRYVENNPTRGNEAVQYARLIDELISNYEKKGGLKDSKSDNLREDAALSLMKASFYRKNRAVLIKDLSNSNVDPKHHTVQHFLNERFFAIVRHNDPNIAEAYSPADEASVLAPWK